MGKSIKYNERVNNNVDDEIFSITYCFEIQNLMKDSKKRLTENFYKNKISK